MLTKLETDSAITPWRYPLRGIAIRLFITCWVIYALHFATNTVREIYPALSLGDHFSFDVSEYLGLHPDIFQLPDGGVYINNNPGASILGAIPYALARPVIDPIIHRVQQMRAANPDAAPSEYDTIYPLAQEFYRKSREMGYDIKFGLGAAVMQMGLMAPVSALSVVVMFYLLVSVTKSAQAATWLAVLYAFATPVFYRAAILNHNILQAHFALFAFAILWHPWEPERRRPGGHYVLAGFLTGYTLVLDYGGMVIVAVMGLYAIVRWWTLPAAAKSHWDVPLFVLGGGLAVAILWGYQWAAFGNPIFPAQRYMPETKYSPVGYNGIALPQLDLLWINAFGLRFGLFVASPLLLLALYVPAWFRQQDRLIGKWETALVLVLTLLMFLFTAANQFSRLQFNSGVRHMVPVIPFLFLLAAGVLRRWPLWLAVFLGVAVTYWSWCQAMYRDVEQGLGIPDAFIRVTFGGFQLPWLSTLERLGYISPVTAVPILCLAALFIWLLWNLPLSSSRVVG